MLNYQFATQLEYKLQVQSSRADKIRTEQESDVKNRQHTATQVKIITNIINSVNINQ